MTVLIVVRRVDETLIGQGKTAFAGCFCTRLEYLDLNQTTLRAMRSTPNIPNLTDEQRQKLSEVDKDYRQRQWQLMEKMHDLAFQSDSAYHGGKLDEQAARKNYDAMASLRKQMFENSLEERKRIDSILTPQQREQLQRSWGGSR